MKIKKLQDEKERNVLLVVHDERGRLSDIIDTLLLLLQDLVEYQKTKEPPLCPTCGGEGTLDDISDSSNPQYGIRCEPCKGLGLADLHTRYSLVPYE